MKRFFAAAMLLCPNLAFGQSEPLSKSQAAAIYLSGAGNLATIASPATARVNLGAAASGANSDITSLTALTAINSVPVTAPVSITATGSSQATSTSTIAAQSTSITGGNNNYILTPANGLNTIQIYNATGNPNFLAPTTGYTIDGSAGAVITIPPRAAIQAFYANGTWNVQIAAAQKTSFGLGGAAINTINGFTGQNHITYLGQNDFSVVTSSVTNGAALGDSIFSAETSGNGLAGIGTNVGHACVTCSNIAVIGAFGDADGTSTANIAGLGYEVGSSETNAISNDMEGTFALFADTTGNFNHSAGTNAANTVTDSYQLSINGAISAFNLGSNIATLGTVTGGSGYTNGTYTAVPATPLTGTLAIDGTNIAPAGAGQAYAPLLDITVAGGAVTAATVDTADACPAMSSASPTLTAIPVVQATWASNVATLNLALAHSISVLGSTITVSGVNSTGPGSYNGSFTVLTDNNGTGNLHTITVAMATNPGTFWGYGCGAGLGLDGVNAGNQHTSGGTTTFSAPPVVIGAGSGFFVPVATTNSSFNVSTNGASSLANVQLATDVLAEGAYAGFALGTNGTGQTFDNQDLLLGDWVAGNTLTNGSGDMLICPGTIINFCDLPAGTNNALMLADGQYPWLTGTNGGLSPKLATPGSLAVAGPVFSKLAVTNITTAGAATLTAAGLTGGVIMRSGSTAAYSDTTDAATNIEAAMPGAVVGDCFRLTIDNNAAFAETLLAGSGVTLSGVTALAASTHRDFVGCITSIVSPAVTLTGTGSGPL